MKISMDLSDKYFTKESHFETITDEGCRAGDEQTQSPA
jgi:hypothetical protein